MPVSEGFLVQQEAESVLYASDGPERFAVETLSTILSFQIGCSVAHPGRDMSDMKEFKRCRLHHSSYSANL